MRMCGVLKGLDIQCVVKQYPIPNEKLINTKARNSRCFTTPGNSKGFYQRELNQEDRRYFALIIPDGAECSEP
jgi:hypothetical protein